MFMSILILYDPFDRKLKLLQKIRYEIVYTKLLEQHCKIPQYLFKTSPLPKRNFLLPELNRQAFFTCSQNSLSTRRSERFKQFVNSIYFS